MGGSFISKLFLALSDNAYIIYHINHANRANDMLQITTETINGTTYYTFAGTGKTIYTVDVDSDGFYNIFVESATTTTTRCLRSSELTSKALKSFAAFYEADAVAV